ncbi:MAG TPA: hypothetical protein VFG20_13795 [Planctomycetaceae bacterium]|jgi:hypothetical protein|nr:hypothetical protein [Planctomycetaceae bacterium]
MTSREDFGFSIGPVDRHAAEFRIDDPDLFHTGFKENLNPFDSVIVGIGTRQNLDRDNGRAFELLALTTGTNMLRPDKHSRIESDDSLRIARQPTSRLTARDNGNDLGMGIQPVVQPLTNPHHRRRMPGVSRRHTSPPFDDFAINEREACPFRRFGFRAEEIFQGGGLRDDSGHGDLGK